MLEETLRLITGLWAIGVVTFFAYCFYVNVKKVLHPEFAYAKLVSYYKLFSLKKELEKEKINAVKMIKEAQELETIANMPEKIDDKQNKLLKIKEEVKQDLKENK